MTIASNPPADGRITAYQNMGRRIVLTIGRINGRWFTLAVALWITACSSQDTAATATLSSAAPFLVAPAASVVTATQDVYVSLPPDSIPAGVTATITNYRTGASATAAIVAGGFDPVAIQAATGDTLAIVVQTTGATRSFALAVPPVIPPVIVRTDPPPHKRDVPLNASLVIVFSQPIDATTLTGANVQLFNDGTVVPGVVSFSDAQQVIGVFQPSAPLAPNSNYQIAVGSGVRDTHGNPLAPVSVPFATGDANASTTVVASISVSPISVTLAAGGTFQLSATVKDASGNVMPNAAVTWASSNTAAATVSLTGLVQAGGAGTATITASAGGLSAPSSLVISARTPAGPALKFASVTVGVQHSCALTADGVAYCWGYSAYSGTGATGNSSVPLPVITPLRFTQLAAGEYETCGVTIDGALYCWGSELYGAAVGASPTRLLPEVTIKAISVGGFHNCALATTGAAYCWGFGYYGQLGADSASFGASCPAASSIPQVTCRTPTPVAGGLLFKTINADNGSSTCGVTISGAGYCWGDNLFGTLGVGSNVGPQGCIGDELDFGPIEPLVYPCSTVPAAVTGGKLFIDIQSECGIALDSRMYCWGPNGGGALGVGTTSGPSTCSYVTPSGSNAGSCAPAPTPVVGGLTFIQLSGSEGRHCGLTAAGEAYCWGVWGSWSSGGYQYTGQSSTTPVLTAGGIVFASISTSGDHSCGVTSAGAIYCWGGNGWGQLGDGTTTQRTLPVQVMQP